MELTSHRCTEQKTLSTPAAPLKPTVRLLLPFPFPFPALAALGPFLSLLGRREVRSPVSLNDLRCSVAHKVRKLPPVFLPVQALLQGLVCLPLLLRLYELFPQSLQSPSSDVTKHLSPASSLTPQAPTPDQKNVNGSK